MSPCPYSSGVVTGAGSGVWARRPVLVDAITVSALLVAELLITPRLTGEPQSSPEATLTVLTLAAVPLRTRWPAPSLALTSAGAGVLFLLRGNETLAALAPLFALYVVALRSDRRVTVLAWTATVAVLAPTSALGARSGMHLEDALSVLPWTGVVAAVANGLRNRRAYLAAVEERAARTQPRGRGGAQGRGGACADRS